MQPELIVLGLVLGAIGSALCVLLHDTNDVIANAPKPYSANWRERRQKARVASQAYRRRKPLPYWQESPF